MVSSITDCFMQTDDDEYKRPRGPSRQIFVRHTHAYNNITHTTPDGTPGTRIQWSVKTAKLGIEARSSGTEMVGRMKKRQNHCRPSECETRRCTTHHRTRTGNETETGWGTSHPHNEYICTATWSSLT